MVENRNGLIVEAMVTHADGKAEADAALLMADGMRSEKGGERFTAAPPNAPPVTDRRTLIQLKLNHGTSRCPYKLISSTNS